MQAAKNGHTEVVSLLLEHKSPGCGLQEHDMFNQTPLHYAAMSCRLVCAKLLTSHGAMPSVQDVQGVSPMHLACERNAIEVGVRLYVVVFFIVIIIIFFSSILLRLLLPHFFFFFFLFLPLPTHVST